MHKCSKKLPCLLIKIASGEEIQVLSDGELNTEETSETEAIDDSSSTSSGKFCLNIWNHFSKCYC